MNISRKWLEEYIDINLSNDELSEVLTAIGLEVEGITKVESIKGGLKGIVIGKVLSCDRHPNADKLSLTTVDVGEESPLQIVCGAPNVAAGQSVVVATVGAELHPTEGDSWKIKKGKIRGKVSEGMICAEDELGLGTSHEGIIVLKNDPQPGTLASEYFNVENDIVFDIGLTPNRSDATSHIGVARDLSAYFKVHNIGTGILKLPKEITFQKNIDKNPVEVKLLNTEACPRYSGVSLSNITIKPSPEWIQNRLKAIGVRPISNIVDITNYVLHEYGQPLHAFDQDKIANQTIKIQTLSEGSSFISLDEVDRKLSDHDLMICDGEDKGMCIAGVFGGAYSGVTDNTSNVFLEAAHFSANWIRKTSTRHILRTDAAICFEKGSDPNITTTALKRATQLMIEYADAELASDIIDIYPEKVLPRKVKVKYQKVNDLIGIEMDKAEIENILSALNIDIVDKSEEEFTVAVPTDKADVTRDVDVIEEILRIFGFNNVKTDSTIKSTLVNDNYPSKYHVRNKLANFLSAKDFNEMMNLSLIPSKHYQYSLPDYHDQFVYINNTSNIHLDIMRPEMMLPALLTIRYNQNRQQSNLKFYEFGRFYQKLENDAFNEKEQLILIAKGDEEKQTWAQGAIKMDFYNLKRNVLEILERMGLSTYQKEELDDSRFDYGMRYYRGPQTIVSFGAIASHVLDQMEVEAPVFYAEFDFDIIAQAAKKNKVHIIEISKFPSTRRDLALVIDENIRFDKIEKIAFKTDKKLLKEIELFDVYKNEEHLGKAKKSYAISLEFQDNTKTLKDKEVEKIITKLTTNFAKELGATIRK